ncbi:MAG: hypothetical protein HC908_04725 [Calothrix sp. SM1_7_51]|nr:hypothetical protein [Calothrix sp. SM1_7_51]
MNSKNYVENDKKLQADKDGWLANWSLAIATHSTTNFPANSIKVYFMPGHALEGVRGFTIRPEKQPILKGHGSIVTVNTAFQAPADLANELNRPVSETLGHEIGHALLDSGAHEEDTANLMSDTRHDHNLTADQKAIMYASQFAH